MKVEFIPQAVSCHALPDGHVALILPPKAAQYLADLHASVGGDPQKSRRKWADAIDSVLQSCGFDWKNTNIHGRYAYDSDMRNPPRERGFMFNDNEEGV